MALSDRQCRIIRRLTEGEPFESAVQAETENFSRNSPAQTKTRLLAELSLSDITQIRLWASKITDEEFHRLCAADKLKATESTSEPEKPAAIIIPNTCRFPKKSKPLKSTAAKA